MCNVDCRVYMLIFVNALPILRARWLLKVDYCKQSYMEVALVFENDIMYVIVPKNLKIILCALIL